MNDLAAGWEEAWELTVVVGDVLGGNSLGSFIFSNSPLFGLWFVKGIRRERVGEGIHILLFGM